MADNRKYVAVKRTRLSSGCSSAASSFFVAQVEDRAGNTLTMADFGAVGYGVLEPGTDQEEHFTFNAISGTEITFASRGLAMKAPYTNVLANQKAHAASTVVILYTNSPAAWDMFANKENDESINGVWTFSASNPPRADGAVTYGVGTEEYFATKRYADSLAIAGAPDASTTQKGVVEEAVQSEVTAGTSTGGTSAKLFVPPDKLAVAIQNAVWVYAVEDGTGSDDTYTAALTPAAAAWTAGMMFAVKLTVANTGACTINLNSLGAKAVKKYASGAKADPETGDIVANMTCLFYYDGTDAVLLNPNASMPTTAILSEMATFFGSTDMTGAEAETLTNGSDANGKHYHKRTFGADSFAPTAATDTKVITHNLGVIPKIIKINYASSTASSDGTNTRGQGISDGTSYALLYMAKVGNPSYDWATSTSVIIYADDATSGSLGWDATLTSITSTQFTIDVNNFANAADIVFTWEAIY